MSEAAPPAAAPELPPSQQSAGSSEAPAVSSKVDPETLVLRGSPRQVVRFRRGAIIAVAALGSSAITGVTWMALTPPTLPVAAGESDRPEDGASTPPEVLADVPKSYGDVPVLGPPLPGDLGRPILKHRRSIGTAGAGSDTDEARAASERAAAERERLMAERTAARESGVMMQLSGAGRPSSAIELSGTAAPDAAVPVPAEEQVALDSERDPGGQQRKADFLARKDTSGDINPHALMPAASPYMLAAGSVIAASLITGLNSDLPGLVTAQVTENVYDSVTGRTLLIPQGSRLIGSYDSVVAFGQRRALVAWQRIILPDGSSLRIDDVPASDTAGYAGLADKVDFHSWQLLKGVVLSTLLGVGTELGLDDESDLVRAVRESAQQGVARAGDQIVMKNLNVQPTITVRPGWSLRVVVHKDLVLAPWRR